jgi:hypothetical protein
MTEPIVEDLIRTYRRGAEEGEVLGCPNLPAGLRAVDRAAVRRVLDALESWVLDPIDTDPTRQTLMVWIRKMRGAQ